MNLTNSSESTHHDAHQYKMETSAAISQEMMYYQNSGQEMQNTDGFLSSILNDEDLQLMDIPMNDYNGRAAPDYGNTSYRYLPQEDPQRMAPVAQKKHQMYGKRYFHDHGHMGSSPPNLGPNNVTGSMPVVPANYSHYPPAVPTVHPQMDGSSAVMNHSEMKYSCTMDFRPEISGVSLDHVHHNHTYHMSPEGPSGINRPHPKDRKGRKSDAEKHLTRDEKRAMSLNLPITCEEIINLPMDEFNERISKYDLTESQLSLIRDIRRRGKNKVAAQNCRKRKLDQIVHLAEEVRLFQYKKNDLLVQFERLKAERHRAKHKFSLLYQHVFQSLRDSEGNPYSSEEYSLQQSADGTVHLVSRSMNPPTQDNPSMCPPGFEYVNPRTMKDHDRHHMKNDSSHHHHHHP